MFHVEHLPPIARIDDPFMTAPDAVLVSSVLSEVGIDLPPSGVERLVAHAAEMLRWNGAIRLTAITDPVEVAVKHIADSLLLLKMDEFEGETLDAGSGPGYPGIPLAIARPHSRFTLVETTGKKCSFLSRVVSQLGLANVEVRNARLDPKSPLSIGPFDQIVSRATFPPREALSLLPPYLASGGRFFLMTGSFEAGAETPPGLHFDEYRTFDLPREMGRRVVAAYRSERPA